MTEITQKIIDKLDSFQIKLKQVEREELINYMEGVINHHLRGAYDEGYNDGKIGGSHTEEACGCGQPSCRYCN